MGSVFRCVADTALHPCGGDQCQHCGRADRPIYDYTGRIVEPSLAADPVIAAEEPHVYEVCADCIRGGNLRKSEVRVQEATRAARALATDTMRAVAEYHRLPDIPLFLQWDDWPMCCGEWCEFTGVPSNYDESRQVPAAYNYWERGPAAWRFGHELLPESLREVSLFRCVLCSRPWFTWQFT